MSFLGLFFLLLVHFVIGKGLLCLLKVDIKPIMANCLSLIIGVVSLSFIPLILQIVGIKLTTSTVFIAIILAAVPFFIVVFKNTKLPRRINFQLPKLYEVPFLLVCFLLVLISVWRCFYYPPLPRDLITGPELIAEYAVKEGSLINSVFTVDLSSTNNYFKSPYITGLQIIYKFLVCPFGQLWLSVLSVPFLIALYVLLKEKLHPVLAGFVLMCFITIPDLYAFSYLVLYDYSNMVFFFFGVYFLNQYFEKGKIADLRFSIILMGFATYIRTETLLLIVMLLPLVLVYLFKKKATSRLKLVVPTVFILGPLFFYVLVTNVFIPLFIPIKFDIGSQINISLQSLGQIFSRINSINNEIIFSELGRNVYGYFLYFFMGILIIDLSVFRKLSKEAILCLYCIAVVYFGLALLGCLVPLVDIQNTTKRGFYKFLPIMVLYMRNSGAFLWVSQKIRVWETGN